MPSQHCHCVNNIEGLIVCDVMVWCLMQSGAFKLSREGFVLLQFAPAAGVRIYDWSRKQVRRAAFVNTNTE